LLIELEQVRATISKALLDHARSSSNFLADQPEKAELIRNILACDAETRLLIVPRQQELKATFGSIDTEKKYLDLSIKRFKEIKNIKLS